MTDSTNAKEISEEEREIWQILETVSDPEVPVLSVVDLGIIRMVSIVDSTDDVSEKTVKINITPTYSGCPAMDVIRVEIRMKLLEHGYKKIDIQSILSPAWTTDWMSEAGKKKLFAYGIAPPQYTDSTQGLSEHHLTCPQCHSTNTQLLSQFGSTACKALYQCQDCKEPFDYFKCH
jgi:ring-1,2-phenylacetyl-CoA epoxidase subunit PaaD